MPEYVFNKHSEKGNIKYIYIKCMLLKILIISIYHFIFLDCLK